MYIRICNIKVHIFTGLKGEGNLPLVAVVIYNKIILPHLYTARKLMIQLLTDLGLKFSLKLLQNLRLFTHPENLTDVV